MANPYAADRASSRGQLDGSMRRVSGYNRRFQAFPVSGEFCVLALGIAEVVDGKRSNGSGRICFFFISSVKRRAHWFSSMCSISCPRTTASSSSCDMRARIPLPPRSDQPGIRRHCGSRDRDRGETCEAACAVLSDFVTDLSAGRLPLALDSGVSAKPGDCRNKTNKASPARISSKLVLLAAPGLKHLG